MNNMWHARLFCVPNPLPNQSVFETQGGGGGTIRFQLNQPLLQLLPLCSSLEFQNHGIE